MNNQRISAVDAVKKIKSGELDLVAWNTEFIERIKSLEPKIQAWAYFDEALWLEQCEQSKKNIHAPYSEMVGVPVGVKDVFNTLNMPTCMGSPIWEGFTPGNDARVVHNILFNQGIVAGKTVTAEFAVHTPNKTHNPWNLNNSPGTSSSGSAAAVACGMVPLALGTQTGGSITRPSSYCGVYGFKPSFGTIPRTGVLKTTDTLDTIGLFATNAADCRLLFDVMRVHGLDYPVANGFLSSEDRQNKIGAKWKVGVVLEQHWSHTHIQAPLLDIFQKFLTQLKEVVELTSPAFGPLFNESHKIQETIYHKSLSYYFKKEFENQTLMSPLMYEIVVQGRNISPDEYQAAIGRQRALAEEVDAVFENGTDILITLTTSGTAPEFGTAIDPPDTCLLWTMCGLPVISVPAFTYNGMPFGLQVIARKYSDYKLIKFIEHLVKNNLVPEFSKLSKLSANV
jgi:Asp-tRNA(Asn)/Glu-tRNA(Gln) amidotransferase A subunit family amidase